MYATTSGHLMCGENQKVFPVVDYDTITSKYDKSRKKLTGRFAKKKFNPEDLMCLLSDKRRIGIITKYV